MKPWRLSTRAISAESVACETCRDAISAILDGESPGVSKRKVAAHLGHCQDCQRFEAQARTLTNRVSLQSSPRAPESLKSLLARELDRTVAMEPPVSSRRTWRVVATLDWRRSFRWAGALAPAAAVIVILPLGVLSGPQGKPTHASTPCTIHLQSHRVSPVEHRLAAHLPTQGQSS
jgi:predicted anti-sigma-YlaC factor YlaD